MDSDAYPGGPKTYGSYGSVSARLIQTYQNISSQNLLSLQTYRLSAQPARLAGSVGAVAVARPVQQLPEEPASWAGLTAPARQAQPQLQSADTAAHRTRQHSHIERYLVPYSPYSLRDWYVFLLPISVVNSDPNPYPDPDWIRIQWSSWIRIQEAKLLVKTEKSFGNKFIF
jgi:hypothetical protein